MESREGVAEKSLEGPNNDGMKLTENREMMAKNIIKDLGEKTKEEKFFNPESDRISIYILNQLLNGYPIAKEVEQKVITYLNRRIVEIKLKVRNGQVLTGADRQFMREILDASKNYNVKELEIEWFNENKPMDQTQKGKILKVDAKLIKEFTVITRMYWDKILLLSLTGLPGYVGGLLLENFWFRRIDKELKKYSLSIHDLFEFVLSFQNAAVAKAEKMIFENRKIVREERERYQDNKNGAIDELYNILICKNAPKFKVADRLRAKGLMRCLKNRPGLKMEYLISAPFFNNFFYKDILRLIISTQSEEKIAESISKSSPNTLEDIALLIESYNPATAGITKLIRPNVIQEKYSEFKLARLMESISILQMKTADAFKHPILNDVNTDFLGMARRFRDNQNGFKEEIIKILNNREKGAYNTLKTLYKDPSKVWELKPLIELTMTAEKIEKGDKLGQLIWDRVKDIGRGNTIRSIGMAAMGIGLGIAGFFTGGSAWAGLALAAGGATVSGIDLYHELDAYMLHSNAAKATLGGEFSDDPGVLGVTLAVLSLVVDIGSLGNAIKTITNSAKLIAASDDVGMTAGESRKLFKGIQNELGGLQEDEFVKRIQEAKDGIRLPKNDDIIEASRAVKPEKTGIPKLELGWEALDALYKKWGISKTDTISVGKTDVPGLENFIFEGASPTVRTNAGLPQIDALMPDRAIKSPGKISSATRHAEEWILNDFLERVKELGINPKEIRGTLLIHQSNPKGVCPTCIAGLNGNNVEPGIFKQFSEMFPNLNIKVTSEIVPNVRPVGRLNFIIKNGKYID